MLRDAGIDRQECFISNVFLDRPPGNSVDHFFTTKKEGSLELPPLKPGKYIKKEFVFEVLRLRAELAVVKPNLIVTLGGTATWALLGTGKISTVRGAIDQALLVDGIRCKVLPTYRPAAVCRQWELRPTVIADLMKALRESQTPELLLTNREIWIEPSIEEIWKFISLYIWEAKPLVIGFDIETKKNSQISCISFAPSNTRALVIPFIDERKEDWSYWNRTEEEYAWSAVKTVLESIFPKVGQNGLYDIQYLWRQYGLRVNNYLHDTMLLHHSLQPELPKGLGFLGSVYCSERAWKKLRTFEEEKPDE